MDDSYHFIDILLTLRGFLLELIGLFSPHICTSHMHYERRIFGTPLQRSSSAEVATVLDSALNGGSSVDARNPAVNTPYSVRSYMDHRGVLFRKWMYLKCILCMCTLYIVKSTKYKIQKSREDKSRRTTSFRPDLWPMRFPNFIATEDPLVDTLGT